MSQIPGNSKQIYDGGNAAHLKTSLESRKFLLAWHLIQKQKHLMVERKDTYSPLWCASLSPTVLLQHSCQLPCFTPTAQKSYAVELLLIACICIYHHCCAWPESHSQLISISSFFVL